MASPRTQTRYPNGTTQEESEDTDPVNHADPKRLTDTVRLGRVCTRVYSLTFSGEMEMDCGPRHTENLGAGPKSKRVISKCKCGQHNQHRH
jgi:hypothetical protein